MSRLHEKHAETMLELKELQKKYDDVTSDSLATKEVLVYMSWALRLRVAIITVLLLSCCCCCCHYVVAGCIVLNPYVAAYTTFNAFSCSAVSPSLPC